MQTDSLLKRCACAAAASIMLAGAITAAAAQDKSSDLPPYMAPIAGRTASSPADTATENVLALNRGMFELYDDAARHLQAEHSRQAPGHSRPVLGRRRAVHPLPARHGAARGAVGADRLSTAEIGRPQHHGADPGGGPVYRQRRRSVLAQSDGGLSQPDEVRARWPRRDADAGGMARHQPHHPEEQHRVHGRLLGEGRGLVRRLGGVLQEAGPAPEAHCRLGGADPGRPLDGRDRRLEEDARRRLGQGLRGQQHDLCGAAEQRAVQRAGAVLRAGRDQRPADADRDDLVHHHA